MSSPTCQVPLLNGGHSQQRTPPQSGDNNAALMPSAHTVHAPTLAAPLLEDFLAACATTARAAGTTQRSSKGKGPLAPRAAGHTFSTLSSGDTQRVTDTPTQPRNAPNLPVDSVDASS